MSYAAKIGIGLMLLCQLSLAETYENKKLHFQMEIPSSWQVEEMKEGEFGDLSISSESEKTGFLIQLEKVHYKDPEAVLQWMMSGQKTPSKPRRQSFHKMKAASAVMEDSQGVDAYTSWYISGENYAWSLFVPLDGDKCSKVFLTLKELP